MPLHLLAIIALLLAPAFDPAQAGNRGRWGHCAFHLLSTEQEAYERLAPVAYRIPESGTIGVRLSALRDGLIPYLRGKGLDARKFRVLLDGKEVAEVGIDGGPDWVKVGSKPVNAQHFVHVQVLDGEGRTIHDTEPRLFEGLNPPLFVDGSSSAVGASAPQRDLSLIGAAAEIQQRKGSWFLNPDTKNSELRRAFEKYGSDLEVHVRFDDPHAAGPTGVEVFYPDPTTGAKTRVDAKLEDFRFTSNADFNWNWFLWDAMIAGRGARFFKPWLAEGTVELAMHSQQPDGAVWRELSFLLQSYQRPYYVKFGQKKLNLEAFNPPLTGWAFREVMRWNPEAAKALAPRMTEFLRKQREWLENEPNIVVKENGKIIGFRWTALGSGRDNAFRGDLFVDLLTYDKMLIDQERELLLVQGKLAEAEALRARSEEIAKTLNDRYWDEKRGMYVDLVKGKEGGYQRATTLNALGFWPLMAGVPDAARTKRLLENLRDPRRFGGKYLNSLSKDDPGYREEGNYWRGGGWPPDFIFIADALLRSGLRVEASAETERTNRAMKEASNAYKLGHTPRAFIDGQLPDYMKERIADPDFQRALAKYPDALRSYRAGKLPENIGQILQDRDVQKALEKYPDTVWETIGTWTDGRGNKFVSWGKEVRGDGSLHETRGGGPPGSRTHGFAGWGAAVPLESIRSGLGFDAVPAFQGPREPANLHRWLWSLLTEPAFRYQEVGANPRFQALRRYLQENPRATFEQFRAELERNRTREFDAELERVAGGYLTLSPTYDPGQGKTSLRGVAYAGTTYSIQVDRLDDNRIRLTVDSPTAFRLQFNRHWRTSGGKVTGSNTPLASSPIVEVGGAKRVVEITLTPGT